MLDWLRFFSIGPGTIFTVYVGLQMAASLKLKRLWLLAAMVPIPFMAYVVFSTIEAYAAESNLWPIGLIFGSALSAAYLAMLGLVCWLQARSRRAAAS